MRRVGIALSLLTWVAFGGHVAEAKVPQLITYQGHLSERTGAPLVGEHTITFRLYDADTAGTKLWEESHRLTMTTQDNGVFSIVLGSLIPLGTLDFNQPLWLSLEVDGEGEMTPRLRLTATSYAINADTLDGLDSPQFLRSDIDIVAKGQLKLTTPGTAFVIQPATDPAANTTMLNVQNAAGTSKFSVDNAGNAVVAGNLTVSGTMSGATTTNGTTSASWTVGSGTDATTSSVSLAFGNTDTQKSLVFQGGRTNDFAFSDPVRLLTQHPLRFEDASGGDYVALRAPAAVAASYTLTLPTALGTVGQVLTTDASGNLSWANAINSSGTITGVTAGGGLTGGGADGSVTLDVGAGNGLQVNADDVAVKLASGSGLNVDTAGLSLLRTCGDGQLLKWTAATSAWTCAADLNADTGGTITGVVAGSGLTGGGTSGTVTLSLATPVALSNGGTGATTTAAARTNLGAAAGGANSDITSLAGLTTPLSIGQGGTGAGTATAARANLGAAASGANTDIASLGGLTAPLSVNQGGTGVATFASDGLLTGQGTSAVTTTSVGPGLQLSGNQLKVSCMPIGGTDEANRSGTFQMGAFGTSSTNDRFDHLWPVPMAGTLTSLNAVVNVAPGSGKSWTVTLRKNAANTSLSCVISGTNQTCTASGSVSVSAGDRLGVEFVESSGPASGTQGSGWSVCFVPS